MHIFQPYPINTEMALILAMLFTREDTIYIYHQLKKPESFTTTQEATHIHPSPKEFSGLAKRKSASGSTAEPVCPT